ncbi:10049_t:CDS:1, partial [Funneliformis geosporum]
ASEYPAPGIRHLDRSNHSPEIFKDFHNTSVDMWSIGYLIITAH